MAQLSGKTTSVNKPDVSAPESISTPLRRMAAVSPSSQGRQWAAPHVAGALAILLQGKTRQDESRVVEALFKGAAPVSGASSNDAGYGRIDLMRALQLLN